MKRVRQCACTSNVLHYHNTTGELTCGECHTELVWKEEDGDDLPF
jgi:hypothetical protein